MLQGYNHEEQIHKKLVAVIHVHTQSTHLIGIHLESNGVKPLSIKAKQQTHNQPPPPLLPLSFPQPLPKINKNNCTRQHLRCSNQELCLWHTHYVQFTLKQKSCWPESLSLSFLLFFSFFKFDSTVIPRLFSWVGLMF